MNKGCLILNTLKNKLSKSKITKSLLKLNKVISIILFLFE